jgi:hypothetical protein
VRDELAAILQLCLVAVVGMSLLFLAAILGLAWFAGLLW